MKQKHTSSISLIGILLLTACHPTAEQAALLQTLPVTLERMTESAQETDIIDPFDPALPDWIVADDSGHRLNAGWESIQINYVYKWWGWGGPVFDWQEIEQRDGGYRNGAREVPRESVQALLDAIVHLHPTQQLVSAETHTDDYPSFSIEILGADRQRILILSASNDYGGAPWNILYKGRLYAQYDGTLNEPLAKLFTGKKGQPMATYSSGRAEAGSIAFTTGGLPPQMVYGFTGLLPIADSFGYRADVTTGEIEGFIEGRESVAGLGNMIIGRIDELHSIQLALPGDVLIDCSIESPSTHDPAGEAWVFHCPVSGHPDGEYRYFIRVEFGTDEGETFVTEGEISGTWGPTDDIDYLPLPQEIQQALKTSDFANELLLKHAVALASYSAEISMEQGPFGGIFSGEISFFGETEIDENIRPYAVRTPFEISKNQVDRWDLSLGVLDEILSDIDGQPVTHRVREAEPEVEFTIWYAEAYDTDPYDFHLMNEYYGSGFAINLAGCGGLPGGGKYPREGAPLRAFSFEYRRPQFILIDGKAVAGDLDFWPNRTGYGAPLCLLPKEFDTGEAKPFSRVWFNRRAFWADDPPELMLWLNEDTHEDTPIDPKDLEVYTRIAELLPQTIDKTYSTLWKAENIAVDVLPDGQLKVVACEVST